MKAKDTKRAALLVAALEELDEAMDAIKAKTIETSHCMVMIGEDQSPHGFESGASFVVDEPVMLRLLPLVRQMIQDELRKMGVDP